MPDDSAPRPDGTRPDEDGTPPGVPDGGGNAPADEQVEEAPAPDADGEPMRFRVADTGWPPPAGSAGPALPRRTPGATGGPGGGTASADDPAAEPAAMRSGWVTSPPLDDEPWAGLPPAVRDAAAAEPAAPAASPSADAVDGDAAQPDTEPPVEEATEAATNAPAPRTPGRHRGPKGRHGRPRRGLRRRPDDAPDPAGDTVETGDGPLLPPAADESDGPADTGTDTRIGTADDHGVTAGSVAAEPGGSDEEPARGRAGRARRRRSAPTWPATRLGLLALAVVAALVFGVLNLVTRVWPGPPGNPYASASTKAAIAAATAVAAPILSYNYTTIDQKAARLTPLQTPMCATQYKQLITTTVKPLAVQNKATQQATVLAAGVTSASKNAVTVLAFMQLTSTNSVKKGKTINEAQISVSMVKQHGKWLLAGTSANGAGNGGTSSCGGATPSGS